MNPLLTFAPGWNVDIPAGTMLIRADVVLNRRPGPGGFAAVIEAKDVAETIIIRGSTPDTTTDAMIAALITELAKEIRGNRAVVLTRSQPIGEAMIKAFKPFKMIRLLGYMPVAVSDATRHAAVMAERAERTGTDHFDRLLDARYERSEHYSESQDSSTVHAAIQSLVRTVSTTDLKRPEVAKAAQHVLDSAEEHRTARLKEALRGLTANDIPKPTKEN